MSARAGNPRETLRRQDRAFGKRFLLRNLALAVPPAAALLVLWTSDGRPAAATWIAAALFVAWIAGWIAVERRSLRRYRCPACKRTIERPTRTDRSPGDPIAFRCERCAIEWDTGLRESRD